MLLPLLLACTTADLDPIDVLLDTGPAFEPLAELFVHIGDTTEDCDAGRVGLQVVVSNGGDAGVPAGVDVQILSLPDLVVIGSGATTAALPPGGYGHTVDVVVPLHDIGPFGVMAVVDPYNAVPEYGLWPNEATWDHVCCPDEQAPSRGELWGTATSHNASIQGSSGGPLADQPLRPGSAVWRMDLDTGQTDVVHLFDPVLTGIWWLGGLVLHPTEPIVYVTGFRYDNSNGYDAADWLDGWDTLIAIDTQTYQVLGEWDMAPEPYSFTGLASDFVDGADGLYSPGGLQIIEGEIYAIEGMTVEHPDLVHIDVSGPTPVLTQIGAAYQVGYWGGGMVTYSDGSVAATCSPTPTPNLVNGVEQAWIPEPAMWSPFEFGVENTCAHPTFTFGMDRVHGVALGGQDELYAVRSARGHWYDQAELQATDLHVYRVYEDGQMVPMADLSAVLSTVPAPIDGLGNLDWRAN